MSSDNWSVAVLQCKADETRNILLHLYDFVKDIEGVRDLHFLIRDRIDGDVVLSIRMLLESQDARVIKSKVAFKLGTMLSEDKFAIDPDAENPLEKYVAWQPGKRISESGPEKFAAFCSFLGKLSRIAVDMVRENYFNSAERVEMAHLMPWMLGCTEYGLMSPTHWEVGYYDRLEDKACPYLKQDFPKTKKPKHSQH
jgi:hypothetical protein